MERDDKGRYVKGNTAGISTEVAREYQLRSAAKRKENRTLAEVLRRQLEEKASSGSPMTKMEYLIAKALENHSKGALTLKDLIYLQKLLGEDTLNIKTDGTKVLVVSEKSIQAAGKWSKKD